MEEWARARSLPARMVERARIVLLAAAGEQDKEIARQLDMTPKKISRWRKRFLALGLPGLETDAPRSGRKRHMVPRQIQRVVEMTTRQKPRRVNSAVQVISRRGVPQGHIWISLD